jgi:hypothetical protein
MAISNSMTLRATAAVVSGIHGRTATPSGEEELLVTHPLSFEGYNSSLIVSKLDDK